MRDLMRFVALAELLFLMAGATISPEEVRAGEVLDGNKTLQVAAVQFRSSRDMADNVSRIVSHLERLGEQGVRVAVFPECALTGYFESTARGTTAEDLACAEVAVAEACRKAAIYAVIGTPYREGGKLFNSSVVFSPKGKVIERYHKIQLAESWPDAGDHLSVFPVDGVPCSIMICHDERYPELVRLPVLAGARVVFYLSHESGLREERKIKPYRAQIQARAVENTVYVVQANAPANDDLSGSHGQSRIIGPDGRILSEATMFEEEVVRAELDLSQATASNALKSLSRGPLGDWWRAGLKQVRVVAGEQAETHDR